jgi:hypothetical protein
MTAIERKIRRIKRLLDEGEFYLISAQNHLSEAKQFMKSAETSLHRHNRTRSTIPVAKAKVSHEPW